MTQVDKRREDENAVLREALRDIADRAINEDVGTLVDALTLLASIGYAADVALQTGDES